MPDLLDRWTRAEVLALPDDRNRYELVDGALLVTPSPGFTHQRAVTLLTLRVGAWVEQRGIGCWLTAPCDLELEPGQLLQPDCFVLPPIGESMPEHWADCPVPWLVIEILSPATARYDRVIKRELYLRSGVVEYWILDPAARQIERWRPGAQQAEVSTQTLTWVPPGSRESLTIDLRQFFEALHRAP